MKYTQQKITVLAFSLLLLMLAWLGVLEVIITAAALIAGIISGYSLLRESARASYLANIISLRLRGFLRRVYYNFREKWRGQWTSQKS